MNIIQLLLEDHDKMRKELIKMRHCLDHGNLREQIKAFISSYELHESIEEELLFPAVEYHLDEEKNNPTLAGYEGMHEKIWKHMENLMDSLDCRKFSDLQQAFFTFSSAAEAHFSYEERVIFPILVRKADPDVLYELGTRARERFHKFTALRP